MDYAERHPNKDYLSSYDLIGQEGIVTMIRGVRREFIKGSQKKKKEKETLVLLHDLKPMILNITNDRMITNLFRSSKSEDWEGRVITIFAEEGFHFGKNMYGLRVKHTKEDVKSFLMGSKNEPDFKIRYNLLVNKPTTEQVNEIFKAWTIKHNSK